MCTSSSFTSTSSNKVYQSCGRKVSNLDSKSLSSNAPMFIRSRPNEPQCCHCGWRGAHAPGCPFK
ncbi:hypothetical protein DFS33DRAFT_1309372 [Desarmillaria ectypa]|nr:hypothetical protein DFS33DRAFT_1309372 [Desarmillaria ectypa]